MTAEKEETHEKTSREGKAAAEKAYGVVSEAVQAGTKAGAAAPLPAGGRAAVRGIKTVEVKEAGYERNKLQRGEKTE
jgi:hypothetical protein